MKIAQCAVSSLEFCHSLLLAHAQNVASSLSTDVQHGVAGENEQRGYEFDLSLECFLPDASFL